jgi:hypothetical protein
MSHKTLLAPLSNFKLFIGAVASIEHRPIFALMFAVAAIYALETTTATLESSTDEIKGGKFIGK